MNKRKLRRILRESIRSVLKEFKWRSEDSLSIMGPTVDTGPDDWDWVSFQSAECAHFQTSDGGMCYVWMDEYHNPGKWCVQCDEANVYEMFETLPEVCPLLTQLGCVFESYGNIPF